MRRMRRAKIIATLGPASISTDMIQKLFLAGADVFRINMSHASHDSMRQQVSMIRDLLQATRTNPVHALFIFLDLLERQLQLLAELFLAHAQKDASHPHAAADMPINRIRRLFYHRGSRF